MDNTPAPLSPFEQIKHSDDAGEYWSARELASLLEYQLWQNFEKVVKKAMKACEKSELQRQCAGRADAPQQKELFGA